MSASASMVTEHSISFWPEKVNIIITVVPCGKICVMTSNCSEAQQVTATRGSNPLSTTTRPIEFHHLTATPSRIHLKTDPESDIPYLPCSHCIASEIPNLTTRSAERTQETQESGRGNTKSQKAPRESGTMLTTFQICTPNLHLKHEHNSVDRQKTMTPRHPSKSL